MVIDTHIHLGNDPIYDRSAQESDIIQAADEAGVNLALIHPAHTQIIETARELHDRIALFVSQNPGRVLGLACVNPHYGEKLYNAEIDRCVKELGFVGIILDTYIHACNPRSETACLAFEAAKRLGVPLVVTTGFSKFSLPILLFDRAKEYSDVSIIVTRAGSHFLQHEATILARECSNVFLEPSLETSNSRSIRQLVKSIGARRIMMGSGNFTEMLHTIWKFRSDPQTGLSEDELEWCLGRTASGVFRIDNEN